MTTTPSASFPSDPSSLGSGPDSLFEHTDWLRGLARRLASDEADADDLVQQAAVVALRRKGELHSASQGGVRAWLSQVVHNEARNQWRSNRRRRDHEERRAEGAPTYSDPAATEERLELTRSVLEAVQRLEEPYRSAILARYVDDLSPREIAKRQGVPLRTVETRLSRGRERLRQYLSEHAPRGKAWATLVLPSWELKGAAAAGGMLVWKAVAAAVIVAAMGGAVLMARGGSEEVNLNAESVAVEASPPSAESLEPVAAAVGARVVAEPPAAVDALAVPAVVAASQGAPTVRVHGRVGTRQGEPLPGAAVRLYTFGQWSEAAEPQEFGMNDAPLMFYPEIPHGFAAETDSEGRFSLEVPVPTAKTISYVVDAGPYRERWTTSFGDRAGLSAPLLGGERDLGTVALGPTGAVAGVTLNGLGEPIAGVRVSVVAGAGLNVSIGQYSDDEGRFLLGHVPEGSWTVQASAEGFQSVHRGEREIRPGQTAGPETLTLETAPIISGIVRDDQGAPIENVEVGGWPRTDGPGRHARAMTDAEGRFEIALPQMDPYSLSAKKAGYETWGNEHSAESVYDPGTVGLEITLLPAEPIVIRVIDALTEAPVESFGLYLLPSSGEDGDRPIFLPKEAPPIRPRANGVIEVPGREGVDAYALYVEGQAPLTGTFIRTSSEAPHMVIRLEERPTIRGRFVRAGVPIAGATVLAIPGDQKMVLSAVTLPGESAGEKAARLVELRNRSLRRFEPQQLQEVRGTTDEDGFFELTGLKREVHALRLTEATAETTLVYPVDVMEGAVDLGEVEASGQGAIEGRLLLPPGVVATGLKVELMSMRRRTYATADASGRFRFDGVEPGLHEVLCQGRPDELARGYAVPVEVPGGGVGSVEIDLLGTVLSPVRLTLRLRGEPVAGALVFARNVDDTNSFSPSLGVTDEAGVVEGQVPGSGQFRFSVSLDNAAMPDEATPLISVESGVPVDEVVELQIADLSITLPPGASFPDEGEIHLVLHMGTDPFGHTMFRTQISGGQPSGYGAAAMSIEGRTLTHRWIPKVGSTVSLDITDSALGERELRPLPGLTVQNARFPSAFEAVFEMDCSSGTCGVIQLGE